MIVSRTAMELLKRSTYELLLPYGPYGLFDQLLSTYTHYGYIRTTVKVSVLVVLIFSQNFSTNGPYVVLIFCKFSDYMVLIFEKKSHTAYYVFQIGNYQASKQSFGSFLSKKLGSVNFCYKFLKSSKNFGPYFLKVQYQWSLISQISSTGPYMGGPYITILRVCKRQ